MYLRTFREEKKQRENIERFIKSGFSENDRNTDRLPYKMLQNRENVPED